MHNRDTFSTTALGGNGNARRGFKDITNASNNFNETTNRLNTSIPSKKFSKIVRPRPSVVLIHSENPVTVTHRVHKQNNFVSRNTENGKDHSSQTVLPHQNSSTDLGIASGFVPDVSSSYQYSAPADKIDEHNAGVICANDYVQELYDHFKRKERMVDRTYYMEKQPHINEKMRSTLVDWLVSVHLKFKLVPETLYLTVDLIDSYFRLNEVDRSKLQLIGVACLLIASKYEEIHPPDINDLVFICDRAYSKKDIIDAERIVLETLGYRVTIASAHSFLVWFLKAAHADRKMVQLSCYILEGTLQSYNLTRYLPSELAAAAILIARTYVGRNPWSPTLLKYAEYREEEVIPVAQAIMNEKFAAPSELRAVNKKYASSRYGGVANFFFDCF